MPAGGFIGRAIDDAGRAWDEANAATGQAAEVSVNQDNVLAAARIIQAESERFAKEVAVIATDLHVDPVGGDPVSEEAARVLNMKFQSAEDSYVNRCLQRVDMLAQLAHQLGEAARTYGHTEEQIQAQFDAAHGDVEAYTPAPVQEPRPRRGGGMRVI